MKPNHLFYLALFSLSLCGCGIEDDAEDEQSDINLPTADIAQNRYLPLTSNTQLSYSDTPQSTVIASVSYDEAISGQWQLPAYALQLSGTLSQMTLYLNSAPDQINLLGIDGPFLFTVNGVQYEADYLRFADAIQLTGAAQTPTTTASALITHSGGIDISDQFSFQVSYTLTNNNSTVALAGLGNVPTLHAVMTANIAIYSAEVETELPLAVQSVQSTFDFTPGLGIVTHRGSYLNQVFDSRLQSLQGLPEPIWFAYNAGNPIATSSDTTFNTNAGNLSTNDYEIANLDELDALDWFLVNEDSASRTFNVALQYSESLPNTLTAIPVLFRNKHTGRLLSTSVILQP